ncbi:MAG: arginase family protein [Actinomycetota bacterium]
MFTFIGAPGDSVLRGGGAEGAPQRLRELGLPTAIGSDAGDLAVTIRGDERDPDTGIISSADVLAATRTIREAVREAFGRGVRPFVSGGCCGMFPGALAGARDALGPVGLVYIDGHQDLWNGTTSTTGEAADMPLGVAIGVGPPAWVEATDGPGVQAESAFLLANRDHEETGELPDPASFGLAYRPLERVRVVRPDVVAHEAAVALGSRPGRYWVHLDVDAIDSVLFPATDYLQPDGLTWEEVDALLTPLVTDRMVGMSLGCFNPDKDPDGAAGRGLADLLSGVLGD